MKMTHENLIFFFVTIGVTASHITGDMKPNRIAEDDVRLKSLQANTTLMKLLADPEKDNITESEIFDMLHSRDGDFGENDLPVFPGDESDSKTDNMNSPNMQVSVVQEKGAKVSRDYYRSLPKIQGGRVGIFRGKFSAIVLGVTIGFVVIAYLALVIWRRIEVRNHKSKHFLLSDEENMNEVRIEL